MPEDPLDALDQLDAAALEGFELSIGPDGTVTFIDFPPEMLAIAEALNPDDPLVCQRREALGGGLAPPKDG